MDNEIEFLIYSIREGNMEKGYIKTYNWVQGLLKTCDFSDNAKRLGLEQVREDAVLVNFFDRTYEISSEDIALIREKIIWTSDREGYEFDLKSVLGYYVLSEAETESVNEYCPLEHFSGGVFRNGSGSPNNKFMEIFGHDCKKFGKVMNLINAQHEDGTRNGKYIWHYNLLPKMPVKFIFYEGDDEFPSKLQILLDKTAIKIYKFEPLAVLHGCVFQTLLSIGKDYA
jgi:hypothetical protein